MGWKLLQKPVLFTSYQGLPNHSMEPENFGGNICFSVGKKIGICHKILSHNSSTLHRHEENMAQSSAAYHRAVGVAGNSSVTSMGNASTIHCGGEPLLKSDSCIINLKVAFT